MATFWEQLVVQVFKLNILINIDFYKFLILTNDLNTFKSLVSKYKLEKKYKFCKFNKLLKI